ncbi:MULTISPECIES: replication initiation protein RepM [Acinetobacter]|jgi:plasmid replication initiation protein|uniref:replication initiation protein RepM n=1 Tax=Acinetobacter TaxID=469 RepID=UPI000BC7E0B0|nr:MULTISPECIES: replication initiation protein RepM [Acinetobacter]PCN59360.1 RepB family plasmid replication initiator protein [Acinetobacter sp. YT-02]
MQNKDLVVKSNKLIQALQSLTLSEARLIQLAIIDARETGKGLTTEQPLELNAARYAKAFNTTLDAAYLTLLEAEETLFKRQFTIQNEDGSVTKSRWIQDANYKKGEGRILLTLTRVLIDQVTKIDGFETYFTSYHLKQTANFKSIYAVRLYELVKQWKNVGYTPIFNTEKFREQLGIGINEYARMEAFKRRVLDVSIEQINEFSDIEVEYQQHKKGRLIEGFSFAFKQKKLKTKQTKKNTEINLEERALKMTIAQRHFFANKLCRLPELGKYSQGTESFDQFAVRIAEQLSDPVKLKEYLPYLEQVGFTA